MRKRTWILLGIGVVIVIATIVGVIYYLTHRLVIDNTKFILKNSLIADVYSEVTISDYLDSIEGKILKDEKIDTKQLGTQEVSFLYETKEKKKRKGTFTVEVVDREKPLVWLTNSYRVQVGSDFDLATAIFCADNYDATPTCMVEGEYDLNTVGVYPLQYVAKDASSNETRIDFDLKVYEPQSGSSNASEEETYTAFSDVLTNYKEEDNEIGIDVSKWQGEIDFAKVKRAGASFVMIRIGSQKGVNGEYVLDPYFKDNLSNAKQNGLKVGVYFYSYADSNKEAKKQAKWVMEQLGNDELELPIVFDWECYSSFHEMELSLFGLNQVAETFLETVESKGYDGLLYGSKNYLKAIWKYHSHDVWLAHYTEKTDYDARYVMWQLCDDGRIDGIDGAVDIDILYHGE